ncbi:MAG: hypothetical protein JKY54_03570 [Flavobacteriales bacterium]|nr:hypothetical protein [Flavobacteriales bacterium]
MTSYQRVTKRKGDLYTENLNELIQYDLLVVGFIGDEVSLKLESNIKPGVEEVSLKPSSIERLSALMSEVGKGPVRNELTSSIKNQIRVKLLTDKMKVYTDMATFRHKISRVIFPCAEYIESYPSESWL